MDEYIREVFSAICEMLPSQNDNLTKIKVKLLIDKCLNYMHRPDIPEGLILPIAEHFVIYAASGSQASAGEPTGAVAAVKVGDTQINYDNSVSSSVVSDIEVLFNSLRAQLNTYRRIATPAKTEEENG